MGIRYEIEINVYLDGKHVGSIRNADSIPEIKDGFQYTPNEQAVGGRIYATLEACKASLED